MICILGRTAFKAFWGDFFNAFWRVAAEAFNELEFLNIGTWLFLLLLFFNHFDLAVFVIDCAVS